MKIKKSQAALEFLTTYGWAFLVILVMIGALSYFGVLNPNNLVPQSCVASDGWSCEEYVARAGVYSDAYVFIMSNLLESVTITRIDMYVDNVDQVNAPTTSFKITDDPLTGLSTIYLNKTEYAFAGPYGGGGSGSQSWVGAVDVRAGQKFKLTIDTLPSAAPREGETIQGYMEITSKGYNKELDQITTVNFVLKPK